MKFKLYFAEDGIRWRCQARNGKILADSGEAYTRATDARKALNKFIDQIRNPKTVIITDETQKKTNE